MCLSRLTYLFNCLSGSHVVVLFNGSAFRLDVLTDGPDQRAISIEQLRRNLNVILSGSAGPNLGLLTSLPRDKWASLRALLPAQYLREIDEALFVVSFDEGVGNANPSENAKFMLIDCGGQGDRWFDKWQVIFSGEVTGFNLEHSP
jgi:hypothetical protein